MSKPPFDVPPYDVIFQPSPTEPVFFGYSARRFLSESELGAMLWNSLFSPPLRREWQGEWQEWTDETSAVAKTIWILWKENPERVWRLIRAWSLEGTVLTGAGREILDTGIALGHLSSDDAIRKLESWLKGDNDQIAAASRLLPWLLASISPEEFNGISSRWSRGDSTELQGLPRTLVTLFGLNPKRCMEVFVEWARNQSGTFDILLLRCLQALESIPELQATSEGQWLNAKFRYIELIAGKRYPSIRKEIRRLTRKVSQAMSRLSNKTRRKAKGRSGPP